MRLRSGGKVGSIADKVWSVDVVFTFVSVELATYGWWLEPETTSLTLRHRWVELMFFAFRCWSLRGKCILMFQLESTENKSTISNEFLPTILNVLPEILKVFGKTISPNRFTMSNIITFSKTSPKTKLLWPFLGPTSTHRTVKCCFQLTNYLWPQSEVKNTGSDADRWWLVHVRAGRFQARKKHA